MNREQAAATAVMRARAGQLGDDGAVLVSIFAEAVRRESETAEKSDSFEQQANALAAVLADVIERAQRVPELVDLARDVINELPLDARLRVLAYRHRLSSYAHRPVRSQYGPLPDVPPRVSVMRDRVRTIDADPLAPET